MGEYLTQENLILAGIGLAVICYYSIKSGRKCPKCKKNWAWKTVSSYDEPRSTFTKKIAEGQNGETRTQTFEVGIRYATKCCSECEHEAEFKESYKRIIDLGIGTRR